MHCCFVRYDLQMRPSKLFYLSFLFTGRFKVDAGSDCRTPTEGFSSRRSYTFISGFDITIDLLYMFWQFSNYILANCYCDTVLWAFPCSEILLLNYTSNILLLFVQGFNPCNSFPPNHFFISWIWSMFLKTVQVKILYCCLCEY